MPSDVGSWFQQGPGNAGSSIGQVSALPLTWTAGTVNSISNASEELVAAGTGSGRTVWIKVPVGAVTGICIAFGATAATTSTTLIEPGETVFISTAQAINAIRAGGTDVSVYTAVGVA